MRIVKRTEGLRRSRRYPGYLRVLLSEYRKELLQVILEDGRDLIEALEMRSTFEDLRDRLKEPEERTTSAKLTRQILEKAGARLPLSLSGREFNQAAESFYREELRVKHLQEGLEVLEQDLRATDSGQMLLAGLSSRLKNKKADEFIRGAKRALLAGTASIETVTTTLILLLVAELSDQERQAETRWDWAS
jgi:hypothetical protein